MNLSKYYEHLYKTGYTGGNSPNQLRYTKITNILSKLGAVFDKGLEIGCSSGYLIKAMPFKKKYGVDISKTAVKRANANGIKAHICNIETDKLPFKNNEFDLIICCEVLEHLFDIKNFISETKRVLKPNGVLFITVPNDILRFNRRLRILLGKSFVKGNPHENPHIRFYTKKTLKQELSPYFDMKYIGGLPLSYKKITFGKIGELSANIFTDLLPLHYVFVGVNAPHEQIKALPQPQPSKHSHKEIK